MNWPAVTRAPWYTGIVLGVFVLSAAQCLAEEEAAGATVDLDQIDAMISDDDRAHWAFQRVQRPPVPDVAQREWARNPIDNFILARLEGRGWKPSPTAEPRELLRRIYLDLIGLPPMLAEQEAFLNDPSPAAVDTLVDALLSREGYGERWARHWLDLVRYAETNGYERDGTKLFVWRYRDYVIRALNDDKPYDRFILEQLAGDELEDASTETLIATGYYRLGPWDDEPADPQLDRFDQLDDIVITTSQVFLGLTIGCARCHDHKFDSLTMHDYYRLVATFDTLTRPGQGRRELVRPAGSRAQVEALAERDRQIGEQQRRIIQTRVAFKLRFLESGRSTLPAEVVAAFLVAVDRRSEQEIKLVEQHSKDLEAEVAAALDEPAKQSIADAERMIARLREATADLPDGYFLEEKSPEPPPTHLLLRGKATSPGPEVQPGMPTVLVKSQPIFPSPDQHTSRRRMTLARWIADAENPLTARVIVNRVWQHHFGAGLVRTSSDFGVMGEPPTHPELLDWLADWFVTEGGWSLKRLHRLVMSSNAYRMSKRWNPAYGKDDSQNEFLWRLHYPRLEVEAIRDSMLAASGRLNRKKYGLSMYPFVPKAALEGHSDPDKIWQEFNEREASRRTIYAFIKRSMIVPMLEVLDLCDTTKSTAERSVTSVAPQALTLFNGDFVNREAGHFAARLVREVGDDTAKQVDRAYRLALCRPPTAVEQAAMATFLDQTRTRIIEESAGTDVAGREALRQMCRVIFNLNEFAYSD